VKEVISRVLFPFLFLFANFEMIQKRSGPIQSLSTFLLGLFFPFLLFFEEELS